MRRIETQGDIEKKRKRNNIILSVLMLVILVGSTVGYAFMYYTGSENNSQTGTTGNEKIRQVGSKWRVNVSGAEFQLSSSPESIANVSVENFISSGNYYGKTVYIDSNSNEITYEIASIVGKFAEKVQEGCLGACERNLPEKNCSDYVIVWNRTREDRVYQKENCVFIDGSIRSVDAFLYKLIGY
jgi:hypothetical protein